MKYNLLDLRKAPSSPDRLTSVANSFSSLDVPSGTSPSDKTVFARADSPWERGILRKSSSLDLHKIVRSQSELSETPVSRKTPSVKYSSGPILSNSAHFLVIVGPTASGKSALAMELAQKLNGEIICADSRTVYKYLDIGTAKPTKKDRKQVPHHLLDVVNPDQNFTVADFKLLANEAIDNIQKRGRLPIMVGGSGLYIDAVLFDYQFAAEGMPRNPINPRHLMQKRSRQLQVLRSNTLIIGLDVPRDILKQRITDRVQDMVAVGFIEEVQHLMKIYPESKALLAPGYKAFSEYINGNLSIEDAEALFIKNDYQLVRRQMTWFKRNKSIHWINNPSNSVEIITTFLSKTIV